jgi:hypothetical protein
MRGGNADHIPIKALLVLNVRLHLARYRVLDGAVVKSLKVFEDRTCLILLLPLWRAKELRVL